MSKIVVRIAEGLGNQFFMYAHAFALSQKINYKLFIDDESGYFSSNSISQYYLDNFNLSAKSCNNDLKFNSILKNVKRKLLIKSNFLKKKKSFLLEKKNKFKKTSYLETNNQTFSETLYVEGHYESEKYFLDFKNDLQGQFLFKNKDVFKYNRYLDLFSKHQNIVSICVRQNRFSERIHNKYDQSQKLKSDEFTKETISYINRAVNFVDNKINNAKYLVWSNDFNNLRNYLPESKFVFVDNTKNKVLSDFYLLLKCKNFIVGPTTFHWWPAWLNNEKNSLILRPKDINVSDNVDFWPNDWIPI